MKQVVFLSGKGGTGKTFITSNIAFLTKHSVVVDADVDASNLDILFNADNINSGLFESGYEAVIDQEICRKCGKCFDICRFNAVEENSNQYRINPLLCEGCGACAEVCPEKAVSVYKKTCGKWYRSVVDGHPFFHAELFPGSANSGKLVTFVRKSAENAAEELDRSLIIIDGPPGLACPAMAALTNTDLAVLITEPTAPAIHDLERLLKLVKSFNIEALVVINKFTVNISLANNISGICSRENTQVIARIPFSEKVADSISQRKIYINEHNDEITGALKTIRDIIKSRTD